MAIRAKQYKNRKDEKKIQISMDRAEAVKLLKDDEALAAEFKTAVTAAVKAGKDDE